MNIRQKNIVIILIAFSIVAFAVFFILSLKIFDNNNYYYVLVENAKGLNESDMVFIDNEVMGKINKIDTTPEGSRNIRLKITLNRSVNLPDKTAVQITPGSDDIKGRIELKLKPSSGYFDKRDTLPLLETDISLDRLIQSLIDKDTLTAKKEDVLVRQDPPKDEPKKIEPEQLKKIEPEKPKKVEEKVVVNNTKKQVIFKVQFLVSPTELPLDSKVYKGIKQVSFYKDKGMFKYVTGKEADLSKAVTLCETVKKQGFQDAFVVAFDGDQRISIKEAERLLKK